ncbi:MAG: hypothetical protein HY247_01970 [archaeon]|nr:MAG: hypothetical protein HY247_01970 [archaeon]
MAQIHQPGTMSLLAGWALSVGAFRRNKMPVVKKVLAAGLCNAGYSYREVARMVGGLSHIAARDAFLALNDSLPEEVRRPRREVAIDGSQVYFEGKGFYLWLARDVESGEIMCFHASPTAGADDGSRFLADVGRQCENRPALRLGSGANAPLGLLNLDLYFQRSPPPSIMGRLGRFIGIGATKST